MAVGVGINNLGNTSVANTNDLFIIGVRSESDDGSGGVVVSYDTQGITFADIRSELDYVDLTDLSVTEVVAVDGTPPSLAYDANTGVVTYTKPYLITNTEIESLFSAEDAKLTYANGVIGFGAVTTSDITEGTNLFHTNSRAIAAAKTAISVSGSLAYNGNTGVVSYTERTDSEIIQLISGGVGVDYDDSTGEISIGQSVGTTSNVTFGDITSPSLYTAPGNVSTGGVHIYDNVIKFANRSGGAGDNWVGVINQWNSTAYQRLDIGAGDGLTGFGVTPQGAYTSYYGPQDVLFPSQIRNLVRDGSTQKTAGGWYANGELWAAFGADIQGDVTVGGTLTATLDGTASDVESISNFDTADLSEGTNLYFTNGRVISALSDANTSHIAEGSNQYYTNSRADARIAAASIDALTDVDSTGKVDGSLLSWSSANNQWESVTSKDNMPIGTIQWFSGKSENIPAGWLEADGTEVTSTYPTLRQFLVDNDSPYGTSGGNPRLPDMRGRFARGYNPSNINEHYASIVGTYQGHTYERHAHDAGYLVTDTSGAHTHTIKGNNGQNNGQLTAPYIRPDGAETLTTDGQSVQLSGNHTHTVTGTTAHAGSTSTGNETRPSNISFVPIIKAWGSLLGAANLGVADIAGLLDNIASIQQATDGTDNTHFMSPLRVNQVLTNREASAGTWEQYVSTNEAQSFHARGGVNNSMFPALYKYKRAYNSQYSMHNMEVGGLGIGPVNSNTGGHTWIDVGYFLYGYDSNVNMNWGHMPTNFNVQFEFLTASLGFSVGDRIALPPSHSAWLHDEGNSQFFRLEDVSGVDRLKMYIYVGDEIAYLQGFDGKNNKGRLLTPKGAFVISMSKQGPII